MSNVRSLTVRGLGLCALVLGTSATGCLACDASQPAATLRPVLRSDHEGILKNLSIRDVAPMEETIARDTAHAVEQVEAIADRIRGAVASLTTPQVVHKRGNRFKHVNLRAGNTQSTETPGTPDATQATEGTHNEGSNTLTFGEEYMKTVDEPVLVLSASEGLHLHDKRGAGNPLHDGSAATVGSGGADNWGEGAMTGQDAGAGARAGEGEGGRLLIAEKAAAARLSHASRRALAMQLVNEQVQAPHDTDEAGSREHENYRIGYGAGFSAGFLEGRRIMDEERS